MPRHSHENEQLTYILEGKLRFWLGEDESETVDVCAGEVLRACPRGCRTRPRPSKRRSTSTFSRRDDWLDRSVRLLALEVRLGLEGRRALITGGSKGLGEAIARELVSEGARVAICSRNETDVTATAEEVGAEYSQAADVTDPAQVRDLIARTAEALGGIDFLVNNAGGAHPGTFETLSDEDWVNDLDVKLFSLIRCSREVLPHLRAAGGGRIINIGAVYSRYPDPAFFATRSTAPPATRSQKRLRSRLRRTTSSSMASTSAL